MKNKLKRISGISLAILLTVSVPLTSLAAEKTDDLQDDSIGLNEEQKIEFLSEYGFTEDTAEALENDDLDELVESLLTNPENVDINTSVIEIDNLAEIESFVSLTDEELLEMDISQEEIEDTRDDIYEIYEETDEELIENYDMEPVEIDMFRMAVESGEEIKENGSGSEDKVIDDVVNASGTISSTKMSYTQSVINNSTSTKPQYKVTCSYTWKSVYALAVFSDKIVAAWGGGLNTKSISGTAKYYKWSSIGGKYGSLYSSKSMSKEETVQAGIQFSFPQSVSNGVSNKPKTKTGSASFTLYQTKKKGYSTKVLSNYCHRVIKVGGAGITISASGPSVSISIGTAWDKTAQKATTIKY